MGWGFQWRPYVPVAQRRAKAATYAKKLASKEKRPLSPVNIVGRKIAASFWGNAWCDNLEAYSDFANRMPRGRTYVRNGSVIDLQIERGKIKALVSGSDVYTVTIEIATLPKAAWAGVKQDCAQSIESLIDLLGGRFDDGVMKRLSRQEDGMFPKPKEIKLKCSCPDWATMCKHCAAVLYGVGARLDSSPELLFTLRGVDHTELIGQAVSSENLDRSLQGQGASALPSGELSEMFGIDLVGGNAITAVAEAPAKVRVKPVKAAVKKVGAKVAIAKKAKLAEKVPKRNPKPR
jgi:uncharacterized Zn finger protein